MIKRRFHLVYGAGFSIPFKDRDLIVQGKMIKDANGQITIKNKAIQTGYALNPNYVRLTDYQGDWTFRNWRITRLRYRLMAMPILKVRFL